MTDAEWARVRPLLPVPAWLRGRGGRPEAYCHRAILDAIRYLVDNGIKWRAMPADFPPWDRVYAFFRRWRDHGLVREFHDRLRGQVRETLGRDAAATAGVIDSQSVKADAVVGADSRGFDGGKLVNGRKRHVVVDTLGLLLGVMVTAADTGDRTAAHVLLGQVADVHHRLELVWADGGYTGSLLEHCLAAFALVLAIVKRSDDMRGFVVLPKRWIVERFFAHLMRTRRLVRDFERGTASAEAMVYWSMTLLMTRRLARPGPGRA
ncbi:MULTISPECIES: IS5 family transposase [unclassified Streptomyces]|uniref:IS5 family transposase n=1 Tax=unclassified Streptomyces TaxID=2593676 RepID=UPI000C278A47|nr:IS5 family transposase [Streptomyces sp. CB02959]PJN35873.1 IS5/IS1182 family transposase [Streptomyces sp. CB02959]